MKPLLLLILITGCAHTPATHSDGFGPHQRAVTTTSPEAQHQFNRGLALIYAFHHDASIAAFSKAAAADPECAMAYWGVALANGPHINNPMVDPEHAKAAWEALGRAQKATHVSATERALIEALAKRYADPQPADRKLLDQAYAEAMRALYKDHSSDGDIGALFAEALMDLRPWDLWTLDGKPQPETPEIVETLEQVLRKDPKHPLANHLYIHAVEASPHPEKADAAADRLRDLTPELGHLVHMPSHIDVRRGRWREAIIANEKAIRADEKYRAEQGFYRVYMLHNRHMLAWGAIMRGESKRALAAISDAVGSMPPDWVRQNAALVDGFVAMPLEVQMRFGRWDEVLAQPEYPDYLPMSRTLRHAARGIAQAARGQIAQARLEQAAFVSARAKVAPDATFGNNPASALLDVAEHLLAGEILVHDSLEPGLTELRQAVHAEDQLRYDEPPDWIMPVRHALGAALLRAGRAAEAEAVFREDLARLPENGWSLWGLRRSLELQKKDTSDVERRFKQVWQDADLQLSSSCLCLPGV